MGFSSPGVPDEAQWCTFADPVPGRKALKSGGFDVRVRVEIVPQPFVPGKVGGFDAADGGAPVPAITLGQQQLGQEPLVAQLFLPRNGKRFIEHRPDGAQSTAGLVHGRASGLFGQAAPPAQGRGEEHHDLGRLVERLDVTFQESLLSLRWVDPVDRFAGVREPQNEHMALGLHPIQGAPDFTEVRLGIRARRVFLRDKRFHPAAGLDIDLRPSDPHVVSHRRIRQIGRWWS